MMLLQREVTTSSKVAVLPTTYQALAAQAVEYSLACVQLPKDVSCLHSLCFSLATVKLRYNGLLGTDLKGLISEVRYVQTRLQMAHQT